MGVFKMNLDNITTVVCDFDGVLTNNSVFVSDEGHEYVSCSRSDGIGFDLMKKIGMNTFILSTEVSNIVQYRSRKMNVKAFNGVSNKKDFLINYCMEKTINIDSIAYIGNDLNDLDVMQMVGLKVCPADAWIEIINISDLVLKTKGGQGVVREFAAILRDA
jgi:3-deoxy-D-manno-octulosonate 8-phosphate phosphatase (KDO 8-P phosphatase)